MTLQPILPHQLVVQVKIPSNDLREPYVEHQCSLCNADTVYKGRTVHFKESQ